MQRRAPRQRKKADFWKAVLGNGASLAAFGAILTFIPEYSMGAAITAGSIVVIGVIASGWGSRAKTWWFQLVVLHGYFLMFLGLGIRAGGVLFAGSILWPASLTLLYLLAWLLPWLLPRISGRIASEQLTPKTAIGRGCQSIALGLVPAVGGLSVLLSRLDKEPGLDRLSMVLIAMLSSAIAIGASQAYAHQYWQKRPWAQSEGPKQTG